MIFEENEWIVPVGGYCGGQGKINCRGLSGIASDFRILKRNNVGDLECTHGSNKKGANL